MDLDESSLFLGEDDECDNECGDIVNKDFGLSFTKDNLVVLKGEYLYLRKDLSEKYINNFYHFKRDIMEHREFTYDLINRNLSIDPIIELIERLSKGISLTEFPDIPNLKLHDIGMLLFGRCEDITYLDELKVKELRTIITGYMSVIHEFNKNAKIIISNWNYYRSIADLSERPYRKDIDNLCQKNLSWIMKDASRISKFIEFTNGLR